ncbi:MAG: hypothetical protein FWC41_00750 [Firmicutes bacterium]|nr:hypothetical protein [Bacillota bacterium]
MFLSTTLSSNMLDSSTSNATISMPYDFTKGTNHILYIQPCVTTTRDLNPVTALGTWADTRPDIAGAILTPNRYTFNIPQNTNSFSSEVEINITQRIIAGIVGGYGWKRSILKLQITCNVAQNLLQITPLSRTGDFPNDIRPVGVSLILHTVI